MRVPLLLLVAGLTVAGCLVPSHTPDKQGVPVTSWTGPTHVLVNATEAKDLAAPTFKLLGKIGKGAPLIGAGEPSVAAGLDGTLLLTFPGCDQAAAQPADFTGCANAPVYKSTDAGATWKRLNQAGTGKLDPKGPSANGDAEVTVDAAGTIFASNLGAGGIQVVRSSDGGATWTWVGNATPAHTSADRQWMAAAAPGHVIVTYMQTSPKRTVAINTTWDGGRNWSKLVTLDDPIGWLGQVQFDVAGKAAYIPYTRYRGSATDTTGMLADGTPLPMKVARSLDGGATWEGIDTGAKVLRSRTGLHWSGGLMAPALDVTGDGHIVIAWSEDKVDPVGVSTTGSHIKIISSADQGATWTHPIVVTTEANAIMPWLTGGAGDRVAINYYATVAPLDSDYSGVWDVHVAVVDGIGSIQPTVVRSVVEASVHVGGICSRGGLCAAGDRSLLDFAESDLMPDGRLVVSYAADPAEGGKGVEIRAAIQNGGSPLLVR